MTEKVWNEVDNYITDLFIESDNILELSLKESNDNGLPPHNVSSTQGKFFHMLALIKGAKNILEIGTLGGYSTIWFARALPSDGKLITLEANPDYAKVANNNIKRAGLDKIVQLKLGKALDILPQLVLENNEPFDLIFIDADKINNSEYFKWCLKLSKSGTIIIADNVVRNGEIIDETSEDISVKGIRDFNELVSKEEKVITTAIQTVGIKGYDGFAIILVK
jgi:predicted O-methyltransferase YrrM